MSAFELISTTGDQVIKVAADAKVLIGRARATQVTARGGTSNDAAIPDPKVSRRHAELSPVATGLRVHDLDSRNGTFINGTRITEATAVAGDIVTFGKTAFTVRESSGPAAPHQPPAIGNVTDIEQTIVRQVPATRVGYLSPTSAETPIDVSQLRVEGTTSAEQRRELKLSLLLDISKQLCKQPEVDRLLEQVVDVTFQVMNVDRVSVLMLEGDAELLVPRVSKDRAGESDARAVPQSIARRAVAERVAILTDNARSDVRFGGESVVAQGVESAICAPLMGSDGDVLGILYVDSRSPDQPLGDEDLDFLVAFSGIAAVAIENSQLIEQMERKGAVLANFRRYFAPSLAQQIADRTDAIQVGGKRQPVVVFFSDIRGFTAMAERMAPDETARLLNEYLSAMVDIVFEHGGTLDKFVGDAIMALWGTPFPGEDDADRAITAAIDMQHELVRLNEGWAAEGREQLEIGVGINLGDVFVGNIGSERRLEYTAIGDAVNTASRLCSQAGPGDIIVSEFVYNALARPPAVEALEPLTLKGKAEPVSVFRVKR